MLCDHVVSNTFTAIYICFSTWSVISVGGFLESCAQPHESAGRPLQRAACYMLSALCYSNHCAECSLLL